MPGPPQRSSSVPPGGRNERTENRFTNRHLRSSSLPPERRIENRRANTPIPGTPLLDIAEEPPLSGRTYYARRSRSCKTSRHTSFSTNSTPPLRPGEGDLHAGFIRSFARWILIRLVHFTSAHHWYWPPACMALIFIVVEVCIPTDAQLCAFIAKTIVIFTTVLISVLEQVVARVLQARRVVITEVLTNIFAILALATGWTFWAHRSHHHHLFFNIASACFEFIEVGLLVRYAYAASVGNYETHYENKTDYRQCDRGNDIELMAGYNTGRSTPSTRPPSYQEWRRSSMSGMSRPNPAGSGDTA